MLVVVECEVTKAQAVKVCSIITMNKMTIDENHIGGGSNGFNENDDNEYFGIGHKTYCT